MTTPSTSESAPSPAYLWYDLEFTSLDLETAALLQVSMVITDTDLTRMTAAEQDLNLYVRPGESQGLSPWVEENLGFVLDRCRGEEGMEMREVEPSLCAYIDGVLGAPSKDIRTRPVIAGNSVHADYYLSRRVLPKLMDRCHYRLLDVSALKLQWQDWLKGEEFDKDDPALVRTWFPGAVIEDSAQAHDAYYDVQASIAELAFYRANLERKRP